MPKLKVDGSCSWSPMYAYKCFEKFVKFWYFYECLTIPRRVNFSAKAQLCWQKFLKPSEYAGNNF